MSKFTNEIKTFNINIINHWLFLCPHTCIHRLLCSYCIYKNKSNNISKPVYHLHFPVNCNWNAIGPINQDALSPVSDLGRLAQQSGDKRELRKLPLLTIVSHFETIQRYYCFSRNFSRRRTRRELDTEFPNISGHFSYIYIMGLVYIYKRILFYLFSPRRHMHMIVLNRLYSSDWHNVALRGGDVFSRTHKVSLSLKIQLVIIRKSTNLWIEANSASYLKISKLLRVFTSWNLN